MPCSNRLSYLSIRPGRRLAKPQFPEERMAPKGPDPQGARIVLAPTQKCQPALAERPPRSTAPGTKAAPSPSASSHIKPKMHHIAFLNDVLLPLQPQPPRLLSPRLPPPRDVISESNHLSPNKPMLKIRMDDASRLWRG